MSNNDYNIRIINGYKWRDVTNETTSGEVFPLVDVIKCGGRKPDFVSSN